MEVTAAVFIFLVGVLGVISLFAAAALLQKSARDKTMVALAVQEVIVEIDYKLKTGSLWDAKGDLISEVEGPLPGRDRYRYRAQLTETVLFEQPVILAHIVLTWRAKGKEQGEAFDYVFQSGPAFSSIVASFREGTSQQKEVIQEEDG